MLVVDASVVIKWYVEEAYSVQALKIFEDYSDGKLDLLSVQLMPFEVLNALQYNLSMGVRDIERAGES
jgi:predicted nucleic acid-binding protein